MAHAEAPDRIGSAIAAVDAPGQVELVEAQIDLGPGRFALLAVPSDLAIAEVLGIVAYLTAGRLARAMAAAAAERSQIEIARAMPTARPHRTV